MLSKHIVDILSRKEIEKQYKKLDKNIALISISDPNQENLNLNYFKNELYLQFYDLEYSMDNYPAISKEQAKEIKEFILKHDKFIINCIAGQSRSAGIGLAIEYLKGENVFNSQILKEDRFFPNLFVFEQITNSEIREELEEILLDKLI